jgi:hypothetical protein
MRKLTVAMGVLLLLFGCGGGKEGLRNGDLVFVGIPAERAAERGSMDEAISFATGKEGALNVIHVAIAEVKADSVWIIDASTTHGVTRRPLERFLEASRLPDGSAPAYVVKRVQGVDADAAVLLAKGFCGRAYDLRFLPDNEDLYCSELVQKCYLYPSGKPVFESVPMNFKAADGSMPPYWEKHFGKLGMAVPQGLPGTNPQQMSQHPGLIEVPIEW